jgi:predicted metalloprotease
MRPKEYFNAAVIAVALSTVAPQFVDGQQQRTQLAQTDPHLPSTEAERRAAIQRITRSLNTYWGHEFKSCGVDYKPPRVYSYDGTITEDTAVYVAEHNKYYRPEQRESILINNFRLNGISENEAHSRLAHEMGHRVQDLQNRLRGRPRVDVEQEADMLLGVYAKWLKNEGRLPDKFMEATYSWLRNAKPDPDHGTAAQREASVQYGYEHGLPEHFCSRAWGFRAKVAPPPKASCPPGTEVTYLGDYVWCRVPKGWIRK